MFKKIIKFFTELKLTIEPFILSEEMIESYCRIKYGKNKGKFSLVKYSELLEEASKINYDIAKNIKPFYISN